MDCPLHMLMSACIITVSYPFPFSFLSQNGGAWLVFCRVVSGRHRPVPGPDDLMEVSIRTCGFVLAVEVAVLAVKMAVAAVKTAVKTAVAVVGVAVEMAVWQ